MAYQSTPEERAEIVRLSRMKGTVSLAPRFIEFEIDTSALDTGDIEIIEDALRTLLTHGAGSGFAPISDEYERAVIATLGRVEKVLRHPAAILTGGSIPAHVPGAYPSLSCCGGGVNLVPKGRKPKRQDRESYSDDQDRESYSVWPD